MYIYCFGVFNNVCALATVTRYHPLRGKVVLRDATDRSFKENAASCAAQTELSHTTKEILTCL